MSSIYSPEDSKIASEASSYFFSGQMDSCLTSMRKLASSQSTDPKVLLNKALIEFLFRFNKTRSDDYLCQIQHAADLAGSPIPQLTESPSRSSASTGQVSRDTSNPSTMLPVAIAAHYNYALVLFYQRQYSPCLQLLCGLLGLNELSFQQYSLTNCPNSAEILKKIYFPISAGSLLCQRIILLFLEVHFCLQNPQKVFELTYCWLRTIDSDLHTSSTNGNGLYSIPSQIVDMLTGIARPMKLFYIRASLLTGRLALAEKECSRTFEASQLSNLEQGTNCDERNSPFGCSSSTSNDKDVNSEVSNSGSENVWNLSFCLSFVKAQLSMLQDACDDAIKRLNAIVTTIPQTLETKQWESSILWNNMSLAHFRSGNFALGSLKLRRALRETDKLASEALYSVSNSRNSGSSSSPHHQQSIMASPSQLIRQISLRTFSASQHHALLYNCGIHLLFAHKPAAAFNALLSVVGIYSQNPRLWLRLAECCIKVQRPDNLSDWKLEARANCLIGTVGTGGMRKIIIGTSNPEPVKPWLESASMPTPTLEFAALCLRNALLLLPRPPSVFPELDASVNSVDHQRNALIQWAAKQCVLSLPSLAPINGLALLQLISSVLLNSAYVALCLRSPIETIHTAEQVLRNGPSPSMCKVGDSETSNTDVVTSSTNPARVHKEKTSSENITCLPAVFGWIGLIAPPAHRYLAKMYLAEAYVLLDDLPDACSSLLVEDFVGTGESISLLSLHSIDSYVALKRGRASLAPAFLFPQTHARCGLNTHTEISIDRQKSSADLKLERNLDKAITSNRSDFIFPGQSAVRSPDFPVTVEQAIGVLLYNLAVCCSVRGDYSVSRQLLENAAPALLASDHIAWNPYKPIIAHGKEEHRNLLYPSPLCNMQLQKGVPDTFLPTHLPTHFILLWLYLDLSEDRIDSALSFVRGHLGHVANSSRLTDHGVFPAFSSFIKHTNFPGDSTRPPNDVVFFDVGDRPKEPLMNNVYGFCDELPKSASDMPLGYPPPHSERLCDFDGGPQESFNFQNRAQVMQRLVALQRQQKQLKQLPLQIHEPPPPLPLLNQAPPPLSSSSWKNPNLSQHSNSVSNLPYGHGHWGVATTSSSVLSPNDSEWPPL